MRNYSIIILYLIIFTGCTKQLLVKNYPATQPSYSMFGQVLERSFYYPVTLPDSLQPVWESSTKGSFTYNSALVEGNYVYTSDLAANIFCFDQETGKTIGADKGKGEIVVSPILNNGLMYYVITEPDEPNSLLISYDIRKGKRLKEIEIPGRVGNELIKLGNDIVLVTDEGVVYLFNIYLQEKWKTELNKKVYSSPAAIKNMLYVVCYDGTLILIDVDDGEINSNYKLPGNYESAMVITNDIGLIGNADGDLIAFNLRDGNISWKFETHAKIKSAVTHNNKYVYVGNLAGSLFCLNISDGKLIWDYYSEGMFNAPAALFLNTLIQPDVDSKVLFFNAETGALEKTLQYEARVKLHPTYFNDYLYIGVDRGELFAYKLIRE